MRFPQVFDLRVLQVFDLRFPQVIELRVLQVFDLFFLKKGVRFSQFFACLQKPFSKCTVLL